MIADRDSGLREGPQRARFRPTADNCIGVQNDRVIAAVLRDGPFLIAALLCDALSTIPDAGSHDHGRHADLCGFLRCGHLYFERYGCCLILIYHGVFESD